jgi:hypothetical protein
MSLRVLIFATTYIDTVDRLRLTSQWLKLHTDLNPLCDFLIVDSASPMPIRWSEVPDRVTVFSFADNIGHLSKSGRDGWGRAFCYGLQRAVDEKYDYVVHIEGDSLFRLPVLPIIEEMHRDNIDVASVPIGYGKSQRSTWVETGIMFFRTGYLSETKFIECYNWPHSTAWPTPEVVIRILLGLALKIMPWKAERSDNGEIRVDNVHTFDWITHCKPEVYDRFVEVALS